MRRKVISRCLIGMIMGVGISTIITIAISITAGDGKFYAVVPQLIQDCNSEIGAVTLQAICSMLYGAAWAGASLVWECENWSILKQTLIHFAICSLATFPTAYFMRWMEHTPAGILSYFGIFIAVYAAIWAVMFLYIKRRILQMNERLLEKTEDTSK